MLGYINNRVGDSVLVKFNFSVICSLCLNFFIRAFWLLISFWGWFNFVIFFSLLFSFSVICSLCLNFFIKACLLFLQIFWIYSNGQQNKTHYSNRAKCEKDCYFFFSFSFGVKFIYYC